VVQIRSALVGDKMNVGEVEGTLNEWAALGWHVKSIVETQVAGRVGPGVCWRTHHRVRAQAVPGLAQP
jgi:hypothetical protein